MHSASLYTFVYRVFLLGVAAACAEQALAQQSDARSVLGEMKACARIDDDGARLACFDSEIARLADADEQGEAAPDSESLTGEGRPETTGGTRAEAAPGAKDRFGLPPEPAPEEDGNLERSLVIADIKKSRRGDLILTMANGQVWRQTDSRRLPTIAPGTEARVRKTLFGNFLMTIGGGRTIRVERTK